MKTNKIGGNLFSGGESGAIWVAQQSVHLTGGILRHFQA
jgi:hypothetical protein